MSNLVENVRRVLLSGDATDGGNRCLVAPSPELKERLVEELATLRGSANLLTNRLSFRTENPPGFNDGLIYPGNFFPLGTSAAAVRSAAAERTPLRGALRVIVVLVDFDDRQMAQTAQHFWDLFFSTGVVGTGSVQEYYNEISNGLVSITGEVVGPFRLPETLATYAHGDSGTGVVQPNARTMAADAATAANPLVDFAPYDNDADGFVDAFVVIHAGSGAEVTGSAGDIWSHKWILPSTFNADGTSIFGYLTVPEDCRIGVCAHELGHLLFGWPDLYDTNGPGEGIGNWCLMAGGSWNGGGNTPAHASAWCKSDQGWVSVVNQTSNATVNIADVKISHTVYRLWKDGTAGNEYFLVENRQRTQFDADLPADGLLIWHIDTAIATNSNDAHPKVALMQADGNRNLELGANRGDGGDPFPGSSNNVNFNNTSTPNSKSYGGMDTCVGVTNISATAATMSARLNVNCGPTKLFRIEKFRIHDKIFREKSVTRDKFLISEKSILGDKSLISEKGTGKEIEKPITDKSTGFDKGFDWPGDFGRPGDLRQPGRQGSRGGEDLADIRARLEALEQLASALEPMIGESLRPDVGGDLSREEQPKMLQGEEKRSFDSKQMEG